MSATSYGWLVLAFPLAGLLVISLGWRVLPGRTAGWIASGAILGSFLASIGALVRVQDLPREERHAVDSIWTYAATGDFDVELGIFVDPLAVFMCLVVSGVSFLIHVYSISYVSGDHGFARFFAYLNYFVFSMLLLVLAGNFILLIVGWAFVGAASYLLISFWYRRDTATHAGIKAFVMNVIGDVGLVIAAFLILNETGQLDYLGVFERAPEVFAQNDGTIVATCLLLLVGAFAKSAQLPLHTWLPDAMEGPTPVSALIHAATMVTAGVYLIARTFPLFELAPTAADIGAIIGTATLVFAATVALVQTDLKRVIAYSTMSQIGYMVLGVSAAAYSAGLFHLMTHAFFKALLFMGAGSVIGAMAGIQDMDRMGGFRKAMPFTFVTFTIGALALAAFPFTSGFFSKDEVLAYTINRGGGYVVLAIAGYFGTREGSTGPLPDRSADRPVRAAGTRTPAAPFAGDSDLQRAAQPRRADRAADGAARPRARRRLRADRRRRRQPRPDLGARVRADRRIFEAARAAARGRTRAVHGRDPRLADRARRRAGGDRRRSAASTGGHRRALAGDDAGSGAGGRQPAHPGRRRQRLEPAAPPAVPGRAAAGIDAAAGRAGAGQRSDERLLHGPARRDRGRDDAPARLQDPRRGHRPRQGALDRRGRLRVPRADRRARARSPGASTSTTCATSSACASPRCRRPASSASRWWARPAWSSTWRCCSCSAIRARSASA